MDRGSYAAASAGLQQIRRLEIVNNNLANVNTPGFKRQFLVNSQRDFDETLAHAVGSDPYAKADDDRTPATEMVGVFTDFSLGTIRPTGNPLDVALENPNDFFVIQTPEGPQYSRAGNFTLDANNALVTPEGLAVQGDGGEITAASGRAVIGASGIVRSGATNVGTLQVVRFEDTKGLEPVGGNRFKVREGGAGPTPVEAKLATESLEMSNVSAITSMVEMISASRGFELYTRTARSIDDLNNSAISQVGRPR